MRIEIVLFFIAALWIAHIYTDGKYLKMVMVYKKYFKIVGICLGLLFVYWLFKKNPENAQNILLSSNEYIKYLPIDKNASSMLSPILDFTTKRVTANGNSSISGYPILPMPILGGGSTDNGTSTQRILQSGKKGTKRSVSETKKKFVAARQNWRCGDCNEQLNAWFEVDHKIRLEYGGSNHVDNLVALCRECHGKKTAIENL